jgi:hypothetical protein
MSTEYLPQALACIFSMQQFRQEDDFVILVAAERDLTAQNEFFSYFNIKLIDLSAIQKDITTHQICSKYTKDQLRWALKPCLIEHLLEYYDNVIYVDNDCYFVNDYSFLLDELNDETGILLTPHWRSMTPNPLNNEFDYNLLHGVYNAGFIGCNQLGLDAMKWWKEVCNWHCDSQVTLGRYVDQKYLDLMSVYFSDICKTIRHKGCNVACWNRRECKRVVTEDGTMLINDEFPIIFVHLSGHFYLDETLTGFAEEYRHEVEKYKHFVTSNLVGLDSKMWGICQLTDNGWIGPLKNETWSRRQDAEQIVDLYKIGGVEGFERGANYKVFPIKCVNDKPQIPTMSKAFFDRRKGSKCRQRVIS